MCGWEVAIPNVTMLPPSSFLVVKLAGATPRVCLEKQWQKQQCRAGVWCLQATGSGNGCGTGRCAAKVCVCGQAQRWCVQW